MQGKHSNPGAVCIAGSLSALALYWLPLLIERFLEPGHLSPALLVSAGICGAAAMAASLIALVFYLPLCLRVRREPGRDNWVLWSVATVLLLATGGSFLLLSSFR